MFNPTQTPMTIIYIYMYIFILPKSILHFSFFLHFLIIEPTILHFVQKQNCNFVGISPTQTLGHRFSLRLETVPADFPSLNPPRLDFVGRFFSASEELNATLVKCQAAFSVRSIECESTEYVCEKKTSFGDGWREFGGKRGWNFGKIMILCALPTSQKSSGFLQKLAHFFFKGVWYFGFASQGFSLDLPFFCDHLNKQKRRPLPSRSGADPQKDTGYFPDDFCSYLNPELQRNRRQHWFWKETSPKVSGT